MRHHYFITAVAVLSLSLMAIPAFSQDANSSRISSVSGKTAKNVTLNYVEASSLNIIGKLMNDTPNPYTRVDTCKFKGFTASENEQVRNSSGLAVVFRTNSTILSIKTTYGSLSKATNTNWISARGYDLYIKGSENKDGTFRADENGKWIFAAANVRGDGSENLPLTLINNMSTDMKECLLYLPLYSEEYSIKIGVEEGATIEAIGDPFRHRVGIFGSSYTHGSSTTRAGMTYPAQFTRNTGIQLLSLGCSGNSKLQSYFADVLAAADVDAYIFDAFSNPSPEQIETRLFPFIEKIQTAHPDIPLIFQKTIRRESRNFNMGVEASESAKMHMVDSLMNIACKKYKNVYYVICTNATSADHQANVDGTHPSNYGYTLWAQSIQKPVLNILKKYGIR